MDPAPHGPPLRRVAFDARPLEEPPGGLRRYLGQLLPALVEAGLHREGKERIEWIGVGTREPSEPVEIPGVRIVVRRGPRPALLRPLWESRALPRALDRVRPEVFFSAMGTVPGGVARARARSRCAVVATLHDLAFLGDRPHLPWRHRVYWRRMARRLHRADRVIAVSATTRSEALARRDPDLGLEAARITTIPEAPAPAFRPRSAAEVDAVRQRFDATGEFLLVVGAVADRRKNLGLAAEAARLGGARRDRVVPLPLPLLVVGREAPGRDPRWPHLRRLGPLPDADLAALMTAATAVLVPSLDEGFGLPAVEAMACGAPLVASTAGALPETTGGAARLADPRDVAAWVAAIERLLEDAAERRRLGELGRRRAAEFSWPKAAEATLEVLESAAAGG